MGCVRGRACDRSCVSAVSHWSNILLAEILSTPSAGPLNPALVPPPWGKKLPEWSASITDLASLFVAFPLQAFEFSMIPILLCIRDVLFTMTTQLMKWNQCQSKVTRFIFNTFCVVGFLLPFQACMFLVWVMMHNVTGRLSCFFSFVCRGPQIFRVLLAVMITNKHPLWWCCFALLSVRPASWTNWIQFATFHLHETLYFENYSRPSFAYYTIIRLLLFCPWLWSEVVETLKVDVLIKAPLSRTDSTPTPMSVLSVYFHWKHKIGNKIPWMDLWKYKTSSEWPHLLWESVELYWQNPYLSIDWARALWRRDDLDCKY